MRTSDANRQGPYFTSMRTLPLTQGFVAILDDADYDRATALGSWQANLSSKHTAYGVHRYWDWPKNKALKLHRFIMGLRENDPREVDHINGNGLDNRRCNLRVVTRSQNAMNRRKKDGCSSRYKGVSYRAKRNRWAASICINGKRHFLGHFLTEEDAHAAYSEAAATHFGQYARAE